MENTAQNRYKFYAQYYGQEVARYKVGMLSDVSAPMVMIEWLELKPLSSITDEDAIELSLRLGRVIGLDSIIHENNTDLVKNVLDNYTQINCLWMLPARFIDKARELGYAIDWNEVSVENQVEYGWIKLNP